MQWQKNELFKQFINNGKIQSKYDQLPCLCSDLINLLGFEKIYLLLSVKLSNPFTPAKTYWSILKPL